MKGENTNNEFSSLAIRYLSGELFPGEARRFREILEKDTDRKKLFEEYRKIWESAGSLQQKEIYDLDAEWALMSRKLSAGRKGSESIEKPESGEFPLKEKRAGEPITRSLLFYTYRIAAVLVVGLIIAFAWIYGTRVVGTEKLVAEAKPAEVVLSDGTRVTLNLDSKIRYRKTFREDERRVYLEGEAFFEVTEDPSKPFRIHAGNALVEVLGTRFNVNAYRKNPTVEIAVESGLVVLSSRQEQQEQIVLRAGNSGTYNKKSRQLKLNPRADPNIVAWKTRELYFDSTPLREVVDLVNSVYHTNLVIMNDELAACPITVTFKQQSLDAILNVLERTLDLEITREGDQIMLKGEGCPE